MRAPLEGTSLRMYIKAEHVWNGRSLTTLSSTVDVMKQFYSTSVLEQGFSIPVRPNYPVFGLDLFLLTQVFIWISIWF